VANKKKATRRRKPNPLESIGLEIAALRSSIDALNHYADDALGVANLIRGDLGTILRILGNREPDVQAFRWTEDGTTEMWNPDRRTWSVVTLTAAKKVLERLCGIVEGKENSRG